MNRKQIDRSFDIGVAAAKTVTGHLISKADSVDIDPRIAHLSATYYMLRSLIFADAGTYGKKKAYEMLDDMVTSIREEVKEDLKSLEDEMSELGAGLKSIVVASKDAEAFLDKVLGGKK